MSLALLFLKVPQDLHQEIMKRWSILNCPPLVEYAPYAAYVLTVEIFLQIALSAHLISSERPSNRVDIAYLFYLPFCMMFVSYDRLHRKCAPLFLRKNQSFIWGQDLKEGLCQVDGHYSKRPDSVKERGVMSFAGAPPKDGNFYVAQLWDRHLPGWRGRKEIDLSDKPLRNSKLAEEVIRMADAPTISPNEIDFDPSDTDSLTLKRLVRKNKGSWYQVPKDIDVKANHET